MARTDGRIFFFCFLFLLTTHVSGQWTQTQIVGNISTFLVSGTNLFAGSSATGVFRTVDNGSTVDSENTGLPRCADCSVPSLDDIPCFAILGSYIFIGTGQHGVYRTSNNGASWAPVATGLPTFVSAFGTLIYNIGNFAVIGNNLFATADGVYLSKNSGASWAAKNAGFPSNLHISKITAIGNALFTAYYYGTGTGNLYGSIDSGTTWFPLGTNSFTTNPFRGAFITCLGANGNTLFAFTDTGTVYSSPDKGKSWTSSTLVNAGYPNNNQVTCFAASNNKLFAGSDYGGIYLSTDNGLSWVTVNSGLPYLFVGALAVKDTFLFAGIYGGPYSRVWRRPLSQMGGATSNKQHSVSQLSTRVTSTAFRQSTHTVAINLFLAQSHLVTVKIYNLSGREIASLANSYLGAGMQSLSWDTRNMATGCYAARIQIGSSVYANSIAVSQ